MDRFYLISTVAIVTSIIISLILVPVSMKLAPKVGAIDIPKDDRRMHTKPMSRFGGMAIFVSTTVGLAYVYLFGWADIEYFFAKAMIGYLDQPINQMGAIIVGGILIYLLGIIDDIKGLQAKVKFAIQLIIASSVYFMGIRIQFLTNHFGSFFGGNHSFLEGGVSFAFTVIWIVGITNTVNLIDGLDGLASGVTAIASICLAFIAYIHGAYLTAIAMGVLAGSTIGFLPYNFHPAKTFMGDGGSLFLGYMLSTISIIGPLKGATVMALIVPILVLGLPIFDTAFAILRRAINGRPIMEADKGHLHHRIMAAGMGQRRTVLMLYAISGSLGVASILFSRDLLIETAGLLICAGIFIYVFITDENNRSLRIKAINTELEEKDDNQIKMELK